MGWIMAFWASGARALGNTCDETPINGARSDDHGASAEMGRAALGHPDAQIAEETKRRQLALVARYVATVRGR